MSKVNANVCVLTVNPGTRWAEVVVRSQDNTMVGLSLGLEVRSGRGMLIMPTQELKHFEGGEGGVAGK